MNATPPDEQRLDDDKRRATAVRLTPNRHIGSVLAVTIILLITGWGFLVWYRTGSRIDQPSSTPPAVEQRPDQTTSDIR